MLAQRLQVLLLMCFSGVLLAQREPLSLESILLERERIESEGVRLRGRIEITLSPQYRWECDFENIRTGNWRVLKVSGEVGGFLAIQDFTNKHTEYYVDRTPIASYFMSEGWIMDMVTLSPLGLFEYLTIAERWVQRGSFLRVADQSASRLFINYSIEPSRVASGSIDQAVHFQFPVEGPMETEGLHFFSGQPDTSLYHHSNMPHPNWWLIPATFESSHGADQPGLKKFRANGTTTSIETGIPATLQQLQKEVKRLSKGMTRADYGPTIPWEPYDPERLKDSTTPASSIPSILDRKPDGIAPVMDRSQRALRNILLVAGGALVIIGIIAGRRQRKI